MQLSLSPTLRYGVATEYGVWDYSLALASNIYAPLWKGAALDIRHVTPVANSDDYEEGGYWQNSAFERGVDRVVAHQAFSLPYGFAYQLSLGRIRTDYEGYTHDLAWHSPQGHHSLSYQYSDYEHRDIKGQEKSVSLAGYHYSRPEWDWQLDIVGGEFWNSDKGYEITTNHWFGDFNVFARYLNSQFEGKDKEQFLTLGVAFPIDVWRGMKPVTCKFAASTSLISHCKPAFMRSTTTSITALAAQSTSNTAWNVNTTTVVAMALATSKTNKCV